MIKRKIAINYTIIHVGSVKLLLVILSLLTINSFLIITPKQDSLYSILYSNPLFLRVSTPTANSLLADKLWFLTKNIDEITKGDEVDSSEMFQVYKNIAILDPTLEIAVIYASTYLVSIAERGDLAIKLLKIAQKLDRDNFQYLFTELIFQIAYLHNPNLNYLKELAIQCGKVQKDKEVIGKIDVTQWVNDIITYLQNREIQQKIYQKNREWLHSFNKRL